MIEHIIFNIMKKANTLAIEELMNRLQKNGIDIIEGFDFKKIDQIKKDAVLLITDKEYDCKQALSNNIAVIAYLHDENKRSDFSKVQYVLEGFDEVDEEYLHRTYKRIKKLPWNILETKRCRIREITVEDVDALYEIYREPQITYYMENLYEDPNDEKEYTRGYINHIYAFYDYGMWIVEKKDTGELIGRAGLEFREGYDGLELGYVIGAKYQRQRYAYEVCKAILEYAFDKLNCNSVYSLIHKNNTASVELCKKLGFGNAGTVFVDNEYLERYVVKKESPNVVS